MKEQLITYETALLAKEKGFSEPCINYWVHDKRAKEPHLSRGIEYNDCECDCFHDDYVEFDWNNNTEDSKMIRAPYPNEYHKSQASAPTQEQLYKWLRENHYFHINLVYDWITYDVFVHHPDFNTVELISFLGDNAMYTFTEYEDAFEIALQEALKLIGE